MPPPESAIDSDEDFLPPSWQFEDESADSESSDDSPPLAFWPLAERPRPNAWLIPLARTQDAIARLEASVDAVSDDIATGLRARVSLHEASGFLGHRQTTVHPRDLALHDAGLTGSYAAASVLGTLANELPWSFAHGLEPDAAPGDWIVEQALHFARLWRQLATQPGAHRPARWGAALKRLGAGGLDDDALTAWAERLPNRTQLPGLLAVAEALSNGMPNEGRRDSLDLPSAYVAACVWRLHGHGQAIALPFWSAPLSRIDALAQKAGQDFGLACLDCIAEAALRAQRELATLLRVERQAATLKTGGRSHLADAVAFALREPAITARGLGEGIGVSSRSALDLLKRLVDEGLLREATGRTAWRAFVVEG
ncbi:MAG: hypothetical protein WCI94_01225 [Rhodospirillales bacterium]